MPWTITSFLPALLAQLIPNTTAIHIITYTNNTVATFVKHHESPNDAIRVLIRFLAYTKIGSVQAIVEPI